MSDTKTTRVLRKWNGKPIPPDRWGKDHRSTLLYIETRCVDYGGVLDRRQLRTDTDIPTRLADGTDIKGHDDLDCIDDFIEAGLVQSWGTGLHPLVSLTDAGWKAAWELRQERANATIDKRKSGGSSR
ncbi:MAG TPA: hypothetical protein VLI71_09840 [Gammaproteobacteria bacterium]|nr:hypothetical protein [Gammaproteobacteria bacterium]